MKKQKLNKVFNLKNKKILIISSAAVVIALIAVIVAFSGSSRVYICGEDIKCGLSFEIFPQGRTITGHVIFPSEVNPGKIVWEADFYENELHGNAKDIYSSRGIYEKK